MECRKTDGIRNQIYFELLCYYSVVLRAIVTRGSVRVGPTRLKYGTQ